MPSYLRFCCFLIFANPLSVHAQTAEYPEPGLFTVGESWEWRQFDNRTKLEEGRLTRTVVVEDGILKFSNGSSAAPIAAVLTDGTNSHSDKPWRSWPIEVGKKWVFNADWKRPDGVTGNTKQDVSVVALEEVTVPAGKYLAYRIEHRGFFSNSRGVNGRQIDTYWYSPDVRADIKHVRDDGHNMYTRELTTYERAAP